MQPRLQVNCLRFSNAFFIFFKRWSRNAPPFFHTLLRARLALAPPTGVSCPQQRCAMLRREFLRKTATGMGAAWLSSTTSLASVLAFETPAQKFNAHDEITLGK